jgi:hypothetical protein
MPLIAIRMAFIRYLAPTAMTKLRDLFTPRSTQPHFPTLGLLRNPALHGAAGCSVVVCIVVTAIVSSHWWTGPAAPPRRTPPTNVGVVNASPLHGPATLAFDAIRVILP